MFTDTPAGVVKPNCGVYVGQVFVPASTGVGPAKDGVPERA